MRAIAAGLPIIGIYEPEKRSPQPTCDKLRAPSEPIRDLAGGGLVATEL
jgi:hypothetical protein